MAAVLLVSGGCTSEPKAGPPSATRSAEPDDNQLPPVALPDLSRMEKSVQQQMAEQYQLLTSLIGKPRDTPPLPGQTWGIKPACNSSGCVASGILASGKKVPRLHKVSVRVGAPIHPPADASTRKRADLVALSDELMKSLQSLFDEANADVA